MEHEHLGAALRGNGRPGRRWWAILLGLTVVNVLTTACSSTKKLTEPGSPGQAVLAALTKTSGAGSFALNWIYTLNPQPLPEYIDLKGDVDLTQNRLQVTSIALTGSDAARLGPGSPPPDPLPLGQPSSTFICIGTEVWDQQAGTRIWAHQTLAAGREIGGFPVTQPRDVFSRLEAQLTNITMVGRTSVDGVTTIHYRGTEVSASARSVVVDLWIDANSLVRQITFVAHRTFTPPPSVSTGATSPAGTTTETITARFSDFGVHTRIQAPPASEVLEEPPIGSSGTSSSTNG